VKPLATAVSLSDVPAALLETLMKPELQPCSLR
jgi:hypothetical protein